MSFGYFHKRVCEYKRHFTQDPSYERSNGITEIGLRREDGVSFSVVV